MLIGRLDKGYLVPGTVARIAVALNVGAQPIFQVSNFGQQIGTKSFKIRKLMIRDNGTGGTLVHIGIGAAGAVVDVMPAFQTVTVMDVEWQDWQIPDYEFFADAMAYADVLGGSNIDIQVAAEEIG